MDPEEEKKSRKAEEVLEFMKQRSSHHMPLYSTRLHAYGNLQRKRSNKGRKARNNNPGRVSLESRSDKTDPPNTGTAAKKRSNGSVSGEHPTPDDERRSVSRDRAARQPSTGAPGDRCGCRRPKRRKRSCRRKRRKRRSCSRRRRRKRRRSCSRRRRRRSCRRRKKKRRGCRR